MIIVGVVVRVRRRVVRVTWMMCMIRSRMILGWIGGGLRRRIIMRRRTRGLLLIRILMGLTSVMRKRCY